jgi:RNA polymerase sigma-70 factor (ECF subfamily)
MELPDLDRAADDRLLAAAAAGNAAAFAALFRRRRGEVYRFALHMTGSPAAADDVTQDVFLAVIRDAGKYQPARATVMAWLCGIARNYARRRWDAGQLLAPLPEDSEARPPAVAGGDPEAELARAQRIEAVRRAVLRLPFKYREVIVLCDLQEMKYEEAAAALGCAVGTVRSRLHRGRALLAEKLLAGNGKEGPTWHRQLVNTTSSSGCGS